MDKLGKMFALDQIMGSAHKLADLTPSPQAATELLIDIQQTACKALGLPEDLPLRAGDGMDD
jgi:hypothetical protein